MRITGVLVVTAVLIIAGLIILPGMLASGCRISCESVARTSMRTIATAQADFRNNDRDGNHVCDFWTGDIYNLYAMCPADGDVQPSNMIKLIELALAGSDYAPRILPRTVAPKECIGEFAAKSGYIFGAWWGPSQDGIPYGNRSDADFIAAAQFAVFAAPMSDSGSKRFLIMNENQTIWTVQIPPDYEARRDEKSGAFVMRTTGPLQPAGAFPADPAKAGWEKRD